jgi:hypothetical protein
VKSAAFHTLAMSLPEAEASSHMGNADIRVRGKIFAGPGEARDGAAIIKLTAEQQEMLCEAEPDVFRPVDGWWGRKGWTRLIVETVDEATAASALWMAWRNVAPAALVKLHPVNTFGEA